MLGMPMSLPALTRVLNEAAARGICDRLRNKEPSFTSKESQDRFKRRFLALVTALFKAADVDGDGTLDEDKLRTPAGRNLEKLLTQH